MREEGPFSKESKGVVAAEPLSFLRAKEEKDLP